MLTVKVCSNEGHETLLEVDSVMLRPPEESASGRTCLTYWPARSHPSMPVHLVDVFDGTVFVMNSNGKTVGDYYLNAPREEKLAEAGSI